MLSFEIKITLMLFRHSEILTKKALTFTIKIHKSNFSLSLILWIDRTPPIIKKLRASEPRLSPTPN